VVTTCNRELPGVSLVLREMVTAAQIEALLAGQIDIGLVRPPVTDSDITTREVLREPLLAALPAEHPLARQAAEVSVADFDGEPFIMHAPSEARYFYEVVVGIFRMARGEPGVHPVHQPGTYHPGAGQGRAGCVAGTGGGECASDGRRGAAAGQWAAAATGRTARDVATEQRQSSPARAVAADPIPRRRGARDPVGVR
jgi:DNA-binding transcriptional LysR family regulator